MYVDKWFVVNVTVPAEALYVVGILVMLPAASMYHTVAGNGPEYGTVTVSVPLKFVILFPPDVAVIVRTTSPGFRAFCCAADRLPMFGRYIVSVTSPPYACAESDAAAPALSEMVPCGVVT